MGAVLTARDRALESFRLDDGYTWTAGSAGGCELPLSHPGVAARHARFDFVRGGWRVTALGELRGREPYPLWRNGRPVRRDLLEDGDVLTLGGLELAFRSDGKPPTVELPSPAPLRGALVRHPSTGEVWHLCTGFEWILGRGDEAFVRVDDASVAHRHAQIRYDGDDWIAEALVASTATGVNGRWLPPHRVVPLARGDALLLGTGWSSLIFEYDGQPPAPPEACAANHRDATETDVAAVYAAACAALAGRLDARSAHGLAVRLFFAGERPLLERLKAEAINRATRSPEPGLRRAAALVLGEFGASGDLTSGLVLEELLRDPAPPVRQAAEAALVWTATGSY